MSDPNLAWENGEAVNSQSFDHAALDSPEDIMREKLEMGMAALAICEEFLKTTAKQEALDILSVIAAESVKEPRRGWIWDQFMWLSGFAVKFGISAKELADYHSVSKQAFQQSAARLNKKFKFPQTSAQRSEDARSKMREAYIETHDI